MDLFTQIGIGVLSIIITLVANTAAGLMPRQVSPAAQAAAPAQASSEGVEYGSLNSAALGKELKYAVQLPPSYKQDTKRRYPVLYFLHGMFGNEGEFQRRGVAAAVSRLRNEGKIGEFIIVAPAGENSFYLNSKMGVRYEDAIIKDLIPHIEKTYRVVGTPSGRAIQGISMGGFGALMLAFKHPEMFSSVSTHSAALFEEMPKPTGSDRRAQFMAKLIGNIFGDPPDEEFFRSNNPMYLAEANAVAIKKAGLKVYFDVGEQDRYGFQESNKAFDARLTKVGIPHEFHLYPGNHGWEYMISVADHSYDFLWKNFRTDARASSPSRTSH
jgi:S-formylglutathione hydrolase FrmB